MRGDSESPFNKSDSYSERNRDYHTINHGLRFQRNRSIDDHDTVIWLGDFNYRIGLSDDKVRRAVQAGDLGTLYQNDQLNLQMVAGHVFPFYSESQITFMPTYKYDNGTDEYDTSEKARIPAWCDRILRKGNNLKQIDYATAPLRFSDHRPVYATFKCTVQNIDEQHKDKLCRALYERRKLDVTVAKADSEEKTHEDHAGYRAVAAGFPPASSDRRKWWLDHGLPARSQIQPPERNVILNPMRPPNPFTATKEPDWIMVGRSEEPRRAERRTSTLPSPPGVRPMPPFPSPRRSSTAASMRRKPAPPVPKKPALLSKSGTGPANRPLDSSGHTSSDDSTSGDRSSASFSTPSQPKISGATIPQAMPPSSMAGNKQGQPPPSSFLPRNLSSPRGVGDRGSGGENLLDQDDEGAKMIPTLQPQRRL
ncbi:MAG: hypothetical protein Q9168_000265 [Polycauliona sp. 1 TL-2023]